MNVLAALAPPPQAPEASGAAPPGAPPAPPGGPPFHSALAEHWARTANAEGQQSEGSRPASQPGVQPKQAQRQEEGQSTAAGQRPLDEQAGPGSTSRTHERARRDASAAHRGGTDASARPSADGAASPAAVSSAASASSSSATGSSTTADATGQGADEGAPLLTATAGASTIAAASAARAGATAENSAEAAPGADAKDPADGVAVASRAGAQATADSQAGAVVAKPATPASAGAPSSSAATASTGAASTGAVSTGAASTSQASAPSAGRQTGAQSQTTAVSQGAAGSPAHTAPLASTREAAAGSTVSGAASNAAHTPAQARPSVAGVDTGALAGGTDTGTARSAQAHGQAGTLGQPAGGAGSPVSPGGASTEQGAHEGAHDGAHARDHAGAPPSTSADPAASAFDANGASAAAGDPLAELLAPAEAADASAGFATSLPGGPVVDMQQVIESARATIELAARQGATLAKIALQPAELGEIRIHLSQSADGLIARVTADTAAAAQALAEGRAELHQSLSSLGVSLLRLDIGSGQPQPQDREGRSAGGAGRSSASGASAGREDDAADALGQPAGAGEATTAATGLDSGGLVDVLA
jgi:flagellar hook-length control protein FliK